MRKKLLQGLLSLAIATILWMSIKLLGTYTTTLKVPLRYEELPNTSLLSNQLPSHLSVRVRGPGHQLILPAVIGVSDTIGVNGVSIIEGGIATQSLESAVQASLAPEVSLANIGPDSLSARMVQPMARRLPIASRLNLDVPKGSFLVEPVTFSPDSARLLGPAPLVSDLNDWPTVERTLKDISPGRHQFAVRLTQSDTFAVKPEVTTASFELRRYTEVTEEVLVEVLNAPLDRPIRLIPRTIEVHYLVPLEDYETASETDINVTVDFNQASPQKSFLRPSVIGLPAESIGARLDPGAIRYVVRVPPPAGRMPNRNVYPNP
jgi:hypothetical protein